jgi:hypothetical protein
MATVSIITASPPTDINSGGSSSNNHEANSIASVSVASLTGWIVAGCVCVTIAATVIGMTIKDKRAGDKFSQRLPLITPNASKAFGRNNSQMFERPILSSPYSFSAHTNETEL